MDASRPDPLIIFQTAATKGLEKYVELLCD
jgi:hypothetical protein